VLAPGHGTVALARHAGRCVAGAVYVWAGQRAIYKYGASDEREQHLRPNNLVMWEAICHLAQQGCRELHLGRTSLFHDGLRRFKLGWGAREENLRYTRYDLRTQEVVAVPDQVAGWHNRLFRWLPTPLARCAGAALYKHVA
jgi:lipid II:glycine glycyltransferase (peptidoglycan interpeptide bridge formation enzyme)